MTYWLKNIYITKFIFLQECNDITATNKVIYRTVCRVLRDTPLSAQWSDVIARFRANGYDKNLNWQTNTHLACIAPSVVPGRDNVKSTEIAFGWTTVGISSVKFSLKKKKHFSSKDFIFLIPFGSLGIKKTFIQKLYYPLIWISSQENNMTNHFPKKELR